MPKGFSDHEKQLIRERLLTEGYKLFSAHGLKKTKIEELAAAAKISAGAFYLFYTSKEALFMDIIERAERRYRHDILAAIDVPGPSSRARLFTIFKKIFDLLHTMPLLQYFSSSDFDLLVRRIPEKLQDHLVNDQMFIEEFVIHCQHAGIPIQVQPKALSALLYPLILINLHADYPGQLSFSGSIDSLLELVAAFCLGEVEIQLTEPGNPAFGSAEETH